MKSLVKLLKRATVSGSYASVASTAALLHGGVKDCSSAFAPVNAVSHWVWDRKSLHMDGPSWRYTATGYVIHHAASIFWAVSYEALQQWLARRRATRLQKAEVLASAATVALVACVVDLRCTPERLTPGFERRLDTRSLLGVYAAFCAGLALHTLLERLDDR